MKAVVLLSGGLDSAVAAYCARKDIGRGELYTLTLDYGQRHRREVVAAMDISRSLDVEEYQLLCVPLDLLGGSSLVGEGEVPVEGETDSIPSTWVPQRNSIFLALAFAYAETVGASKVYTGFNVKDYSGYPDCRPEFVEAMNKALNLASKKAVETGEGIGIVAPLMYKTKAEIVVLGNTLGVPFCDTWSCYIGGEKACGRCDSCRIRLAAFREVGQEDPTEYEGVNYG